VRAEKPDITLQGFCQRLLSERGIKADTAMMTRFFRGIGVTLKKEARSREQDCSGTSRHRARWRAYQGRVGHCEPNSGRSPAICA
jgi:transposase